MKPDRGLRRISVSSAFTGVSMMRAPNGSLPASELASVRNIIPLGSRVFGAVSLSTTLIQGVADIDEKYLAASLISWSVIALANPAIWAEVCDDRCHKRGPGSRTVAVLHVIELPRNIAWRAPGQSWNGT